MKKHLIYWMALGLLVITGCQKELSFEGSNTPAEGSLQSNVSGDCLPKTVNGIYEAAIALTPATNTMTVQVNVTKTGLYTITTDTVNGYYFRGVGTFTALGANTITLRSNGTPFAAGVNNFVVSFDSTICDIPVTVLPAGSTTPAVFTLAGTGGNCTGAVPNGTYTKDVALTSANTVTISVNVTTIGTYNISTTFQGMTFAATGIFATTGPQTVTLNGTGTPTTAGLNTVPLTAGTSTCSFPVTVTSAAVGTLGATTGACTPSTINGTYTKDVALTTANTVQVQINVTTPGTYNISTNTVAGMSFSGTGTAALGTQLVTFTVTFGSSTCTFGITVAAGAGPGTFTANCSSAIVNGTYKAGTALTATNTVDITVNVTAIGTYNISTAPMNGMTFAKSGTFTATGPITITLVGAGTPGTAGTSNIPMPGTTPCTFPVTVTAAATIDWQFTIGTTTYQGQSDIPSTVYDNTSLPPFAILDYYGVNAGGDDINITLFDIAGGVTATEQYASTSTLTTNAAFFYFTDFANTIDLTAQPADPGPPPIGAIGNMIFIVTSHSTATKTIIGTFSGTAFDAISNTTKTISGGTFKAIYH
jgi:hypothetical protein